MSIEAMKQALENELSASDFIDKAPQSWDKTERTEWARLQAMLHNIRVFKKAMRQAIAEAEKQDKFCDDNCVWTDHHKDCVRASVSWKDMAFARLGVVRDKMHPDDVATVQRFLDDDYTHPQPKREPLMAWKPIETAPKDTEVLLYCNKFIPLYIGKKRYGCFGEPQQDEFEWRCSSSGRFANPTYWMPLPKSPIEAAHGIKEKNT